MIRDIFSMIFGQGSAQLRETIEIFKESSEGAAQRDHDLRKASIEQFSSETSQHRGPFNAFVDGVNRLPRPAMALGVVALFVSAMAHPTWFESRMKGLLYVPEPLWWLLGVVVSFYFGARSQHKAHEFQREIVKKVITATAAPSAKSSKTEGETQNVRASQNEAARVVLNPRDPHANAALSEWQALKKM